jgi:hypothetical protein
MILPPYKASRGTGSEVFSENHSINRFCPELVVVALRQPEPWSVEWEAPFETHAIKKGSQRIKAAPRILRCCQSPGFGL